MVVRLEPFQLLSTDLPATMPQMVREEIIGAFGDDGVIRVSTAATSGSGDGPAYVLGGTVRRTGNLIRVITRLTDERSGVALWTDTFDYDGEDAAKIPRRIAVDAGNMVHCGLFAASTYNKPLPDGVMSDYMQFCQNSWWSQQFSNPEKALDAARKVAAAAPDFSWGTSAITVAAQLVFYRTDPGPRREELRRIGIAAADKALSLDPRNSEAFAQKSMLIGRLNWTAQEDLLRKSIAARPLFCGCEHYLYGVMLKNVGRYADAVQQMRRSTELLALDGISQFGLADALLVTSGPEEARGSFAAAVDLFRDPSTESYYVVRNAPETGDYAAAIKILNGDSLAMPSTKRAAILAGFEAMKSGNPDSKKGAATALSALSDRDVDSIVVRLLGLLGAHDRALQIIERGAAAEQFSAASWLWYPSMRETIRDPAATGVVQRIKLVDYWRATQTRPDACSAKQPPQFCALIAR
jgi:tetratricopeptide (TPR) repeat protein